MSSPDIQEAKRRLPLPALMQQLGFGDMAKKSARCIWHDDKTPSFGISEKEGKHHWCCFAGCGQGDEIDFIQKALNMDKAAAIRHYKELAGVSSSVPAKPKREGDNPHNEGQPYTPSISTATVQPPREAPQIAYEPRILDRFREAIRVCGVVGEDAIAATLYLVVTSRLLDRPVSAAVKGLSSSGKSFTTEKTLEFFPPGAVIVMTAMSERALVYSEEEYAHRTLILYEATALREGAEDNLTAYFVRSLLSEGRIEYPVTVRDPKDGSFKTKTIVKEGPTNLIVTTTKTRVHAENETRLLSLNTNDTREQTKAIILALASEDRDELDKSEWRQFQIWLQTAEQRVTIPYAKGLAELVPPVAVRLRRDFGAVLALIRAHAILHQCSRERDTKGRIIATIDDYAQVRELVAPIVSEGVGATVSSVVRETVETITTLADESGVMALAIAERLDLDKGTVSRRLRMAADQGFIRNLEDKRGKPGRWVTDDPLPGESNLLPEPPELRCSSEAGCTVASDLQGVYTQQGEATVTTQLREPQSARLVLTNLLDAIKGAPGLHPQGHPECNWSADYPIEYYACDYARALDYLEKNPAQDEEQDAFDPLARLVHKIDCERLKGTPLVADGIEWAPSEYRTASAYVRSELERQEREPF